MQVRDMVFKANAYWGRIDILVNNAGVMLLGSVDGADTEDWRRMVNTNLLGLMYVCNTCCFTTYESSENRAYC